MRRGIGRLRAGGLAGLPSDAVGIWYMSDYSATPTPYIPNRITATTGSKNLFRASRRLFNNSTWWNKTGVTAVDDAVAGPDAVSDASTLVAAANWKLVSFDATNGFSAGTYTFAVSAKSNSGSNEVFGFTKDAGVSALATETATTSWQRFSRTTTLLAGTLPTSLGLCSPNGATGTSLQVRDFEIYTGSTDFGPMSPDANLYLGFNAFDPITNSGGVQGVEKGMIQLASAVTLTDYTIQAVVQKTSNSGIAGLLSKIQTFSDFSAVVDSSGSPVNPTNWGVNVKNKSATTDVFQYSNWWDLFALGGYHVLTFRKTSGVMDVFLDDVRIFSDNTVTAAPSVRDIYFSMVNGLITDNQTYAGALALYTRGLSDLEVRAAFRTQKSIVSRNGITLTGDTTLRVLAFEGDSITGAATTDYPWLYCANDSPLIIGSMFAVTGNTLASLTARASMVDAVIPPTVGGRKFIISALIGANDLAGYAGGAAQYITDLRAYCVARAAAGWQVCLITILPIDGDATHNARRATVNADIRTNWALYGMASAGRVIDFAANAIMGPDNSRTTNPTYWADAKHPSATGHVELETVYRPVINAV